MQPQTSQIFESYLPVYDAVPDKWEEAQSFIAERFKEIANAVNAREIGFFIDEEVLTGKAFIPSAVTQGDASPQQFRQILRKVVDVSPLVPGINTIQHYIVNDANMTNIQCWVSATNTALLYNITMVYPQVTVLGANIVVNSPGAFDKAFFFWEYCQES